MSAPVSGPGVAWAVLRKDLLLDLRSRDRIGHMAVFAALVVILLSITLPSVSDQTRAWLPALLWICFLLTSLLGLARSFQSETEDGALATLAGVGCDRGWIFAGKAAGNWIALSGVQLWIAGLFAIFLDANWSRGALPALGVALLGGAGLAAVGTLLAALSASARFREFLLPVLLFPLILPVLVLGARMTGEALDGRTIPGLWWGVLALYDWIFALVGYFVFDSLMED